MDTKKLAFLDALKLTFGNISQASRAAGVHRQTHYDWLADDPDYKAEYDKESPHYMEGFKDMIEAKLAEHAIGGDKTILIFLAKTKLKDRGYVERTEHIVSDVPITWIEEKYSDEANGKTK